jgi:hypothetical protein
MVDHSGIKFQKDRRQALAPVWRQIHRRHMMSGAAAILISLLFHLAVFLMFPGFRIYGLGRERVTEKEKQTPLQLKEVSLQSEPADSERRPPRFRPESAHGSVAGEVGTDAATLRRSTDEASVEPRPLHAGMLIGEQHSLAEPTTETAPQWTPHEEILSINRQIVQDDNAAVSRRFIPAIPRLSGAPDLAAPVDRVDVSRAVSGTGTYYVVDDPAAFAWGRSLSGSVGSGGAGGPPPPLKESVRDEPQRLMEDTRNRAAILKAIEKHLKADIYVFKSPLDLRYVYCRIEIHRRTDDALPVLPKDVLLVQDASASITEQKLFFCRNGLRQALELLGPGDRFNVVEFRDTASVCFREWAPVNPDTLDRAREFIDRMRSLGDTDIFGSLQELLAMPRQVGRPVIMQVISDGVATVGLTDRSAIIESFSQRNQGAVSVFTIGTYAGANAYLLDLLSYRNRGDTWVVRSGRWDIPGAIEKRMREVSHPVLSDVQFRFAGQTSCEAYPALTSNLYLDRPLVLFGRYPREARKLVFQATGRADDLSCDMVFDIDLSAALPGDKDIRTSWAWQKAYHLIGEHTRTRKASLLGDLRQLGKSYGIAIPYRRELAD